MYTSLALGVAEAGLSGGAKAAASRFKLRVPNLESGNRFNITVANGKPTVQLPELNISMTKSASPAPNISPFELPLAPGSKTVAATPGGPITLSGWGKGSQLPGLDNPSRQVYNYSKLVGHPLDPHGLDAFARARGGYGASHAERQALVLNPTAQSVTVSKPPCSGCQNWFRAESVLQGRDIPLLTPQGVYNFQSNGTLWIAPLPPFF
ncbi:hypothetical protein NIES4075_73690 [Tolypothrix sp. NIES-4075]|uniref:hypothetical protein n=1 Tax=Tolypothrix sp. NIES-4075 TaxID=2005459 RepID=UPI000B5C484B|nr:hypothetical protein [Tolypothrix sp. NIES-4075]GAX46348.1 hypothetical protein NIES4075_73690 [Tolypothrix sp. NIES-4075]